MSTNCLDDDPKRWRISKSGFEIKAGWGDDKKVIAKYPGCAQPLDAKTFQEWLDNAARICDLHNATPHEMSPTNDA